MQGTQSPSLGGKLKISQALRQLEKAWALY